MSLFWALPNREVRKAPIELSLSEELHRLDWPLALESIKILMSSSAAGWSTTKSSS